jgi:biopolymer transport protein ExbB
MTQPTLSRRVTPLRWLLLLLLLLLCLPLLAEEKAELGSAETTIPPALQEEMKTLGDGDKKTFVIRTGSEISSLAIGDLYRNENKTFFQVSAIEKKGPDGGAMTLTRVAGGTDPGQRFTRAHGAGPATFTATFTLIDYYLMGGFALHPIALLGLLTIVLIVNGIFLYRRSRQLDPELVARAPKLLKQGDIAGLADLAAERRGLYAVVCRAMTTRWASSTFDDVKFRVETAAAGHINSMRFPVRLLNLISVAAPLIGLFGTIVGMVIVFEGLAGAQGSQKAAILASGIRVKLFATAFALIVAVPALFSYFLLNQKVNNLIAEAEDITERCMHRIAILKRAEPAVAQPEADDAEDEDEDEDEAKPAPAADDADDDDEDDAPKKKSKPKPA